MAPVTVVEIGSLRIPISDADLGVELGYMERNGDGVLNGDDLYLQSGTGDEAARYVAESFALAVEESGEVAPSVDFLLDLERSQAALNKARDTLSKIESLRSGKGFSFKAFSASWQFPANKWNGGVLPLLGEQGYSGIVAGALAIYKDFVNEYVNAQSTVNCHWIHPISTNPVRDRHLSARIVAIDNVPTVMLSAVQNLVLTASAVNSMRSDELSAPYLKSNYLALECVGKSCPDNDVVEDFKSPLPEALQCYSLDQQNVTCFDKQFRLDELIHRWESARGDCRVAQG